MAGPEWLFIARETLRERMNLRHLFGPVASRRLGRSLGIDLIPPKTCTYDCVYCECGRTSNRTLERTKAVSPAVVRAELDRVLRSRPELDYLTFAGSGEPTLSRSLGELIDYLKGGWPEYRVAVLTNGSLLFRPDVRADLLGADLVAPTLTSVYVETFRRIHRPHPDLVLERILEGMVRFREEFTGAIWLEVFVIPGLNDTAQELDGLAEVVHRIRPDRVQLNTLDRPAAETWVRAASGEELGRVREALGGTHVEIIGRAPPPPHYLGPDPREQVRTSLSRRPCTLPELVSMTGLHPVEVGRILSVLYREGLLETERVGGDLYYRIRSEG